MDDAHRRDMWAGRIERCLDSRTTIREWCELNKVSKSSLCKWMARFREEEPGRFPRRSSEASNWMKVTAGGIADAKAIVPVDDAVDREPAPTDAAADIGGQSRPPHTRAGGARGIGHTGGLGGIRHSRGDEVGGAANPFSTPDAIYISKKPQDMRAGIQRLAAIVAADFRRDPADGALYCFVSRDCKKAKLLRLDVNGWCLYYVRLSEGGFKWRHSEGGELLPQTERRQLLWLLEGLPAELPQAIAPVAAGSVI